MNEETEALYAELKQLADEGGYTMQSDTVILEDLLIGLVENEKRYGYRSCPCRLASGTLAKDMDIICPCDYRDPDLEEFGCCYCTLYVDENWIRGTRPHLPIPERRPVEKILGKGEDVDMTVAESDKDISVWRCTVCGYLAARAEPPHMCPICKAPKERFEKFLL
ncbi:MAG: ferredoxin:glutaredoxin reductase [ANME-2 cluster archaeon]|nr:ferredoxin:glutaredoxin reductase [ANME-2 cluster archaeon]